MARPPAQMVLRRPQIEAAQMVRAQMVRDYCNISAANNFAENLINNRFADTVFFANSGSEAIECGLKIVRTYQNGKGNKNCHRSLTFHDVFHGRTFLTCAANDEQKFSEFLSPCIDWCDNINIESVKKATSNDIGVMLIESIQGQGSTKVMNEAFMKELRKLCDKNDILLFFDCVQCGAGRTGKLFACEHIGVEPDIRMCSCKGNRRRLSTRGLSCN